MWALRRTYIFNKVYEQQMKEKKAGKKRSILLASNSKIAEQ